jgi:hypothetical protein
MHRAIGAAVHQGTVQMPRCTHPEFVFGSFACRYTDLAPLKPLNTTLIVNETELPEVTITVYPTAHCELVRVADEPMGLVLSVVAALL